MMLDFVQLSTPAPFESAAVSRLSARHGTLELDLDRRMIKATPTQGSLKGKTIFIPLENVAFWRELVVPSEPRPEVPVQVPVKAEPVDDTIRFEKTETGQVVERKKKSLLDLK